MAYVVPEEYIRENLDTWNEAFRRISQNPVKVDVSYLGLKYLPPLPDTVTTLTCYANRIERLPPLPPNLTTLFCNNNKLTDLPDLPATLIELNCGNNQLTVLPDLPAALTTLDCSGNILTILPDLPAALTELFCGYNELTTLPNLPAALTILYCSGNNELTVLPNLPATLIKLYCGNNRLTTLADLPATLTELYCNSNQLTTLPNLPATLTQLYCGYNRLTVLPNLPATLIKLYCNSNQLTTLPNLPASLTELYCGNNPYTDPHICTRANERINLRRQGRIIDRQIVENKEQKDESHNLLTAISIAFDNYSRTYTHPRKPEDRFPVKRCKNDSTLDLDPLSELADYIVIINTTVDGDPDHYIAYCLDRAETLFYLKSQAGNYICRSTEYRKRDGSTGLMYHPDPDKIVFKEPSRGLWIDMEGVENLLNEDTLVLKFKSKERLGTLASNIVSSVHCTNLDIHEVYTLIPVDRRVWIDRERIDI